MNKVQIIFLLLMSCWWNAHSQQVVVSGHDPDYAGSSLVFYATDNYISNTDIKLGEGTVTERGDFAVRFSCKDIRLVYVHLGVFKCYFFVTPGFAYEIKLPPRTDKTPEESASPFFEDVVVRMSIITVKNDKGQVVPPEKELNACIVHFDANFNSLYDQLAMDVARRRPVKADSLVNSYIRSIPHSSNDFFDNYVIYRTALLYYAAQQNGVRYISNKYFAEKPILYDNEAYMDLFNTTYDKYFMYFGRTTEGEAIYDVVNVQGSFSALKHLLGQDGVLSDSNLRELVILKNVYNEFYADRFSRQALLRILDSAILQTNVGRHKEIAIQIRAKITKLLRGFSPPDFVLYNQDSTLVSLDSYRGKYIYLFFCTTQNYVCFSQYELLKNIFETHGKWLQIVVVSADDTFQHMRNFRQKNGYQWDFLHYANDPDILEKYDIRIFPTCYLIDPEGKLVLSPAPSASDNIERALYFELQGKGLWDEYVKKGWIEDKKRTDNRFELDLGIPK